MDELAIVITDATERLEVAKSERSALDRDIARTSSDIDRVEDAVAVLAAESGVPPPTNGGQVTPLARDAVEVHELAWEAVADVAKARLRQRGLDLAEVTLDPLLSADDLARIERRFSGSFRLQTRLDRYDIASVILAATVGAIIDIFFVKIPRTSKLLADRGAVMHGGSPLTESMHEHSLPHDNPLSAWFKVPYDHVDLTHTGEIVAGSGGKSHRWHTIGHDPLLGLLFGVVDIFCGSATAIDRSGHLRYIPGAGAPEHNVLIAIIKQLGHVLSDAFTRMGVPAPGWSALGAVQLGSFTDQNATAGEVARGMYLAGYDARHFLTQTLSVAATDLMLGACWHLRRSFDAEWREQIEHEAILGASDGMRDHPRFEAMALGAHMTTCAANAGKIALYGGSPLALNYAAWMRFMDAGYRYARRWFISPSDLVIRQSMANAEALLDGWPIIDFAPVDAPSLDALGGPPAL